VHIATKYMSGPLLPKQHGAAGIARGAHNPEVLGSKPSAAIFDAVTVLFWLFTATFNGCSNPSVQFTTGHVYTESIIKTDLLGVATVN
jgi:hypothetical protein